MILPRLRDGHCFTHCAAIQLSLDQNYFETILVRPEKKSVAVAKTILDMVASNILDFCIIMTSKGHM